MAGAVLALVLAACSSSSAPAPSYDAAVGAPRDAAPEAFCAAFGFVDGLDLGQSTGAVVDALRLHARELVAVGTPRDIPAAARHGFAVYVRATGAAQALQVAEAQQRDLPLARTLGLGATDLAAYRDFELFAQGTCFTFGVV